MGRRAAREGCGDGFWSAAQVASKLRIEPRRLRDLAQLIGAVHGRGNHACYKTTEVLAMVVAIRLGKEGVRRDAIRRACQYLREHLPGQTPLSGYSFFSDGRTILVDTGGQGLLEVSNSGQLVFGMALHDVVQRCERAGFLPRLGADAPEIKARVEVTWTQRRSNGMASRALVS